MAINGYFFNAELDGDTYDRVYDAEDMTSYLSQLVGNGVFPTPSTQLQVTASTGMSVIVAAGQGWIDGHKLINTAALTLTLDASDALLNRIDRVIFYADYTERQMGIEILKGTAATTPTAPALTRNTTRYEMCLAEITISAGVTSITQAVISDTRPNSNLCGWVAGLIQQVDTSTLFTQWETAYQAYYDTMTAQFQAWFDALTQELNVNTYIEQFHKYVTVTASDSKIIPLDMTGYTYEASDIFFISLNGLVATETVDYLIDTSQTPPEVHVNLVGSTNVTDEIDIKVLKSKIGFNTNT